MKMVGKVPFVIMISPNVVKNFGVVHADNSIGPVWLRRDVFPRVVESVYTSEFQFFHSVERVDF